ncbi:MAG: acyltransferase [Maricaulaceae bacterium]
MVNFLQPSLDTTLSERAQYGYIQGLDGMRAIAVLIVIIAHMGLVSIIPGGFGVTVFFFISGFLITRLLLAEQEKKGQVQLLNFYTRRFLRLFPALLFMIVITTAIMTALGDAPKIRDLISSFIYMMNYNNIALGFAGEVQTGPWGHLWSLAVEEHFYLFFPLLIVMFRNRFDKIIGLCLLLCGAALVWRCVNYYGTNFPRNYNYFATETRIDSILYGCLLSLLLHFKPHGAWRHWLTGWAPLGLAALTFGACFIIRDDGFRETFRYSFQGMALFIAILNLYYFKPIQFCFRILDLTILRWIGRISYGLYLWHIPALYFANNYYGLTEGTVLYAATAMAITLSYTYVSYHGFEQPIIELRKRYGAHIVKAPTSIVTS